MFQISYGATDPVLNDRTLYPYHFSTGINDDIQHIAIAELVERLGWTWVIILALGDEHGESKNLRNEINKHGACVDFIGTLTEDKNTNRRTLENIYENLLQRLLSCKDLTFYMHKCLTLDKEKDDLFQQVYGIVFYNCSSLEISALPLTPNYQVYRAAFGLAHAEHLMLSSSGKSHHKDIHKYIDRKQVTNMINKKQKHISITFSRNCENKQIPVGEYFWSGSGSSLEIDFQNIFWKKNTNNQIYSLFADMENCLKCHIYEWPNNEKTMCIEKHIEFLSYEADSLTLVFIVFSAVSLLLVTVIIGIFISFRDTPVVKANNRNLSFILLFSIKLSFLSVFLFLGRPSDITCILRQTSFGISFSIATPDSQWRKWLGVKITYFIVIICSFNQFLISTIWLIISPPFMELNILSEPGKIIIQCNEGSVIAFYIVLSYMGLLASVSFIVAFLARTLPDSFNEAKYITFSMLLFCSVWITMIPAYLSTKGKYMVAVEIFAIISSSCGLLFCIFLPKCYIIIFKPNRNTKQYLLGNNK
ncbi:hypothetical protein XELAEV_18003452mg [Xenopus laevis]|nr:hypothetical protein XELAEV_18003452mg [Xenopus laevis]